MKKASLSGHPWALLVAVVMGGSGFGCGHKEASWPSIECSMTVGGKKVEPCVVYKTGDGHLLIPASTVSGEKEILYRIDTWLGELSVVSSPGFSGTPKSFDAESLPLRSYPVTKTSILFTGDSRVLFRNGEWQFTIPGTKKEVRVKCATLPAQED